MPIGARAAPGLDVGDRRIGVALSDETATLACGLHDARRASGRARTCRRSSPSSCRRHEVGEVVVGLPARLDGTRGPQAEKVLASWRPCARRCDGARRHPGTSGSPRSMRSRALLEAGVSRRERKARGGQGGGDADPPEATSTTASSRPPRPQGRSLSRRRVRQLILVVLLLARRLRRVVPRDALARCARAGDPPQALVVARGASVHDIGAPARRPRPRPPSGGLPRATCCARRRRAAARGRIRARGRAVPRADRGQARARRRRAPRRHLPRGHEPRGDGAPGRGQGLPAEAFLAAARDPRRSATSTRTPRTSRATSSPTPTTSRAARAGGALVARMVQRFRDGDRRPSWPRLRERPLRCARS